ncbi:hypothetical protein B0H16DRAFT_1468555 [Mycena metata]|uniref:Uncharacterized protein n=1 Tax=Mycena metata TaxID=1033252 RepID=A0AAD7I0F7_9AGAR|nr:hypothetical protein B0H16DRAFT_1468555 [Mycena metata]
MGKSTAQRRSSAKAEQSPSQGTTCGFLSEVKVGVSLCFHNLGNHTIKIVIGNFVLPPSFNPSALVYKLTDQTKTYETAIARRTSLILHQHGPDHDLASYTRRWQPVDRQRAASCSTDIQCRANVVHGFHQTNLSPSEFQRIPLGMAGIFV